MGFDDWGNPLCSLHLAHHRCMWCGSAHDVSRIDGTDWCGLCAQAVVRDNTTALGIFDDVVNWVESVFGAGQLRQSQFNFGGLAMPVSGKGVVGHTEVVWGNGPIRITIKTVSPCPTVALGATLAHELGHVLLFVDPRTLQPTSSTPTDDVVAEGFCEVLSALWLESQVGEMAAALRQRMDRNKVPVYGEGFRRMSAECSRMGSIVTLRDSLVGVVSPQTSHGAPARPRASGTENKAPTTSRPTIPISIQHQEFIPREDAPRRPSIDIPVGLVPTEPSQTEPVSHRPTIRISTVSVPAAPNEPSPQRPVIPIKKKP